MSCRIHTSVAFVAVLSVATWASAQSSPVPDESGKQSAGSGFATEAAEGGLAEIQLGSLAVQKASNEDVKRFAQMMVDDHSKANEQLNQIVQSKHLSVPLKVNSKDQATFDKLSALNGDAFDSAYIKLMVQDHKKDVQEFKKQSASGSDAELKQFASSTLPILQKHLQDAQSLAQPVGQACGDQRDCDEGPCHRSAGTSRPDDDARPAAAITPQRRLTDRACVRDPSAPRLQAINRFHLGLDRSPGDQGACRLKHPGHPAPRRLPVINAFDSNANDRHVGLPIREPGAIARMPQRFDELSGSGEVCLTRNEEICAGRDDRQRDSWPRRNLRHLARPVVGQEIDVWIVRNEEREHRPAGRDPVLIEGHEYGNARTLNDRAQPLALDNNIRHESGRTRKCWAGEPEMLEPQDRAPIDPLFLRE